MHFIVLCYQNIICDVGMLFIKHIFILKTNILFGFDRYELQFFSG